MGRRERQLFLVARDEEIVLPPEVAARAVKAMGARRPSGGEEGEAAYRGRCGGAPAPPRRQRTARA